MARPRARRTTRNPTLKVRRRQKNPYDVSFAAAHPLVTKNWDKKLTLKQNYARLGLCAALNGAAGGTENAAAERAAEEIDAAELKNNIEWRVIDPEAPAVSISESAAAADDEADDVAVEDMEGYDVEVGSVVAVDQRVRRIGHKVGLKRTLAATDSARKEASHSVIADMEAEAADTVKIIRHVSEQEELVFADLIKKHGSDYGAMAMDLRLNKYQLTKGQLKKRIEKLNA
ncbi:Nucleolar protein 16 [Geranomyces variabilis]|uniref:Nucleolar protein 16 n=1 Tax=Geranomyces variabilis TaxID=109894 RepID=A0AAD5TFC8_9FUNG|nr:Nucleolar protein 16 [Geranomyces variabilis]